ncbi:14304_t:CDS:2, partial [Gigaspora margarita]
KTIVGHISDTNDNAEHTKKRTKVVQDNKKGDRNQVYQRTKKEEPMDQIPPQQSQNRESQTDLRQLQRVNTIERKTKAAEGMTSKEVEIMRKKEMNGILKEIEDMI